LFDDPDPACSMESSDLAQLIAEVCSAVVSLGTSDWVAIPAEFESRRLRRSLYVGAAVSAANVRAIRSSDGMSPKHWRALYAVLFVTDVSRGTPCLLTWWADLAIPM